MTVEKLTQPKTLLAGLVAVGALGALYVIFSAAGNPDRAAPPTEAAPDGFVFQTGDVPATPFLTPEGESATLADFEGDVLLVNLWATWCAPCLKEMPSLDRLQAALAGERFRVLAVSIDAKGLPVAQAFLDRLEIEHIKSYGDPRAAFATAIGADNVLPTTILIGADGREIGRLVGPAEWDEGPARQLIATALAAAKAG